MKTIKYIINFLVDDILLFELDNLFTKRFWFKVRNPEERYPNPLLNFIDWFIRLRVYVAYFDSTRGGEIVGICLTKKTAINSLQRHWAQRKIYYGRKDIESRAAGYVLTWQLPLDIKHDDLLSPTTSNFNRMYTARYHRHKVWEYEFFPTPDHGETWMQSEEVDLQQNFDVPDEAIIEAHNDV